jgi:5-methyltetrahydrofolate--homocysteine methyltransferase
LSFGAGLPTVLVNDQLRIMDQRPDVLSDLRAGRLEPFLNLARFGQQVGVDMVDILVCYLDLDEVSLLPRIAVAVHEEIGCPISLDSRNPQALDAALAALQPYKAMVNSVTAERDSLEVLLPIAKKHGAAVVGMPIGHQYGLPRTVEGRLAESLVIIEAAEDHGIPREDIVIDAICLATAAEPDSLHVTLETLRALSKDLGVTTILGIGNAGYGMPQQTVIDLAYLLAAVPSGLDAALVDPVTAGLLDGVRAIDFLVGNDPYGSRYIKHYRAARARQKAENDG